MISTTSRYLHGYSIGAGAVVLAGAKALLVRLGYGRYKEQWAIPGGYVEPGETFDAAARREVLEEAGVSAEVLGLLAARSRVHPNENSAYLIFLMRADGEEAHADGREVLDARYFSLEEIHALPNITPMSRVLVTRALGGAPHLLERISVAEYPADQFALFT